MKTNLTIYLKISLLVLPFVFSSCSKDDEGISSEEKEDIITSNTWVLNEVMTHQKYDYNFAGFEYSLDTTFSVLAGLAECSYDVDYNFLISGILQYTPSESYCGEDINGNFTWDLNAAGNELTIVGDEGALFVTTASGTIIQNELVLLVLEINENVLKCRLAIPFDEFLTSYFGESILDLYDEMGVEISGNVDVDYTWVKK